MITSDCNLFPNMKKELSGHHFDIIAASETLRFKMLTSTKKDPYASQPLDWVCKCWRGLRKKLKYERFSEMDSFCLKLTNHCMSQVQFICWKDFTKRLKKIKLSLDKENLLTS